MIIIGTFISNIFLYSISHFDLYSSFSNNKSMVNVNSFTFFNYTSKRALSYLTRLDSNKKVIS